jgi:hypothetical protein
LLTDGREELGNRTQLDRPAHYTQRHVPIMTASKPRCGRTEVVAKVQSNRGSLADRIAFETTLT